MEIKWLFQSILHGLEICHDLYMRKHRRLWDAYHFPGFCPLSTVHGIFGDPKARVLRLHRRGKKQFAAVVAMVIGVGTTAKFVGSATCPAETLESTWSWKSGASTARAAER